MSNLFPCKDIADNHFSYVKEQIARLGRNPTVQLFLATGDKGSESYSRIMQKKFQEVGILSHLVRGSSPSELESKILALEGNAEITGGFVFYPINFEGIKDSYFMRRVPPFKDVEGLSADNVYRLVHYDRTFDETPCKAVVPCTAKAIIKVLTESDVKIKSQDVVIINKSYSLGVPLRTMFDNLGATVVACDINTQTSSIYHYLRNADIVVTAVPAKTELFEASHLKKGVSVIDCSFEGNFDPGKISSVAANISSKATGNYIGPVTTAMAAVNVLYLFEHQIYLERK